MKYIKTYESANTSYWYSRTQSTKNKDEFINAFLKIATNPNVEEIKLIDFSKSKGISNSCALIIYTSKSEKEKNFKGWNKIDQNKINQFKIIGKEYSNDEIDNWLDEFELRDDLNKYNL